MAAQNFFYAKNLVRDDNEDREQRLRAIEQALGRVGGYLTTRLGTAGVAVAGGQGGYPGSGGGGGGIPTPGGSLLVLDANNNVIVSGATALQIGAGLTVRADPTTGTQADIVAMGVYGEANTTGQVGPELIVNLIPGTGIASITVADNPGNGSVDWTINAAATTSVTMGGDVTGPSSACTVGKILNIPVDAPTNGDFLTYNGSAFVWSVPTGIGVSGQANGGANVGPEPILDFIPGTNVTSIGVVDDPANTRLKITVNAATQTTTVVTMGGDVTGSSNACTVVNIQGVPVVVPTSGEYLLYNGTDFVGGTPAGTGADRAPLPGWIRTTVSNAPGSYGQMNRAGGATGLGVGILTVGAGTVVGLSVMLENPLGGAGGTETYNVQLYSNGSATGLIATMTEHDLGIRVTGSVAYADDVILSLWDEQTGTITSAGGAEATLWLQPT